MQLIIGTVQFGQKYGIANQLDKTNEADVKNILNVAKKNQIQYLDTAAAYGNAEYLLGKIGVKDFGIISKLMPIPNQIDNYDKWVNQSLLDILKKTKMKKLYGLLIHDSNDLLKTNGLAIYNALKKQKEMGLVDKIGVSVYDPKDLKSLIENYFFDIVQLPLNIFDKRFVENNLLQNLNDLGIEVHVRSIFLQGLLLMDEDRLPIQFFKWKPEFKKWYEWLSKNNITPVDACFQFVKSCNYVNKVLVGIQNERQLLEIINAYKKSEIKVFPDFGIQDKKLIDPREWK